MKRDLTKFDELELCWIIKNAHQFREEALRVLRVKCEKEGIVGALALFISMPDEVAEGLNVKMSKLFMN